ILTVGWLIFQFFGFFFQAEDGIRDFHVTGVQTCALPISALANATRLAISCKPSPRRPATSSVRLIFAGASSRTGSTTSLLVGLRSEERRVGKECRSRLSQDHEKTKHSAKTTSTHTSNSD